MINRFILNEVSYFGPGAREVLPKEISRLGLHKAFVATDKDLIKFGVADKVLKVLEAAKIPYEIFSEIKPNPTVSNVKAGVIGGSGRYQEEICSHHRVAYYCRNCGRGDYQLCDNG